MKGEQEHIISLLYRSLSSADPLNEQEQALLSAWADASPFNAELAARIASEEQLEHAITTRLSEDKTAAWARLAESLSIPHHAKPRGVFQMLKNEHSSTYTRLIPWLAAASVLLLLGLGIYMLNGNRKPTAPASLARQIAPGKEGAILTLGDGSQIVLDSLGNGVIATQQGTQAIIDKGQLVYKGTGNASANMTYNTMHTPRGRQFSLVLPDGTKVWLNAASSIRYPVRFSEGERRVEVHGEVYFEVAQQEAMPFRINIAKRAEVAVLGTHFNIQAYDNEPAIQATLLEGSIRVSSGQEQALLKPGQQAQVGAHITVQQNTDINKVMAWKNGLFNFDGATLKEVMRQLERWYDIEVIYEHGVNQDMRFFGEISRLSNLEEMLGILKRSGVHFRLDEHRRVAVLP